MNCGLRHFRNDAMQLSYRPASICVNCSFNFLKKVIRDQRWPTDPLFVVNISPSFREFTAPLHHILLIHNVTINSNNLWISAGRSPFALRNCMTERTWHLAGLWIGAVISNKSHSNKAGSTTVNEHGSHVKDQGRWQCCHNKHKKFHNRPTRNVPLLSEHAS